MPPEIRTPYKEGGTSDPRRSRSRLCWASRRPVARGPGRLGDRFNEEAKVGLRVFEAQRRRSIAVDDGQRRDIAEALSALFEGTLIAATDPEVMGARRVAGRERGHQGRRGRHSGSLIFQGNGPSQVRRGFEACAVADAATVEAPADQRLHVAIARHHRHHAPRHHAAGAAQRHRQRDGDLQILREPVTDHGAQHLVVVFCLIATHHPRDVERPAVPSECGGGPAEHRSVPRRPRELRPAHRNGQQNSFRSNAHRHAHANRSSTKSDPYVTTSART